MQASASAALVVRSPLAGAARLDAFGLGTLGGSQPGAQLAGSGAITANAHAVLLIAQHVTTGRRHPVVRGEAERSQAHWQRARKVSRL